MKTNSLHKLNVCMLIPLHDGPSIRVIPQIGTCSYLTHFGHQVTWIIWSEKDRQFRAFFFNNVQVYAIPRRHYFPEDAMLVKVLSEILNTLKRLRFLIKIVGKEKFNIIFARDEDPFAGLIAAYIKRRYKIPFVFVLVNPLEQQWETFKIQKGKPDFLYRLIAKCNASIKVYSMKKADLVLPTTRWFEEELVKKGIPASKLMPFPNGVDIASFSNQNGGNIREKYALSDSKLITYIGTLGKTRDLGTLIQAFSKVKKGKGNVKLLMVGEGSDEENLKSLAQELGMEGDVIFAGQVPQAEVPNFIATSDIGVSPVPPLSFYKMSSPIKLFEYMAMAKPVVASEEIPEHKEVLEQSGGGILVPFTPEGFAHAIIQLLDNPQKAVEMGQSGRVWVVKNRSYETLARRLEEKYVELLEPLKSS